VQEAAHRGIANEIGKCFRSDWGSFQLGDGTSWLAEQIDGGIKFVTTMLLAERFAQSRSSGCSN
jgi:hypothetical protein